MKVLASHLSFSGREVGVSHYSLARVEVLALYSVFAGMGGGRAAVFSVMFGWSREVIVYNFFLLRCPFPGPLLGRAGVCCCLVCDH